MFKPIARPKADAHTGGWRNQVEASRKRRATVVQSRPSGILVPSADNFQISASVLEHLRDWGEGIASAPRIWRHIAAMVRDGRQDACIHKMHSMANGPSDHNFHGRLVKMLKDEGEFGLLVTGIDNGSSINSMVRPSVMFSWLHRCNRRLFKRIFGANKVTLRSFWERLFSSESGREFKELHPFLRGTSLAELSVVIPQFCLRMRARTANVTVAIYAALARAFAKVQRYRLNMLYP